MTHVRVLQGGLVTTDNIALVLLAVVLAIAPLLGDLARVLRVVETLAQLLLLLLGHVRVVDSSLVAGNVISYTLEV